MSSNDTTGSSTIVQFQQVSLYVSVLLGIVILVGGLLGNTLNIFVFLTLGNYKRNACSFYMLCRSFFDLGVLLFGLSTVLLKQVFRLDFTIQNSVWCKVRLPIVDLVAFSSLTCLCLETIDGFLCSSRSVTQRQMSNVKTARYLVIVFLLLWICHGLPYLFLQEFLIVEQTSFCIGTNVIYTRYRGYFVNLGLYVCIPIIIAGVFGFLISTRLRTLRIQERQTLSALTRQMIHMVLYQIAAVLFFNGPLAIVLVYFVSTMYMQKSSFRLAQEQVVQYLFNIYNYGTYAVR